MKQVRHPDQQYLKTRETCPSLLCCLFLSSNLSYNKGYMNIAIEASYPN
ncbi:unnamed protein product [Spirodela intermedia]|uniref:Uncharacterized protein n=1 Tax=Spirodela intermedia TaxID=51605 RepID=A0A7I8IJX9_SPIIN|nr:unnamed protein product [Spirodela intermedia]CAA6658187.1 unnamed protein product [Spirodela intermedia]